MIDIPHLDCQILPTAQQNIPIQGMPINLDARRLKMKGILLNNCSLPDIKDPHLPIRAAGREQVLIMG